MDSACGVSRVVSAISSALATTWAQVNTLPFGHQESGADDRSIRVANAHYRGFKLLGQTSLNLATEGAVTFYKRSPLAWAGSIRRFAAIEL